MSTETVSSGKPRNLRVLQVVNTLARSDGGPARNAYELHRALNQQDGCMAAMVIVHKSPTSESVAYEQPFASAGIKGGEIGGTISGLRLLKLIKESDTVVIHGYYLSWAPLIAALARILQSKVYLTPHGSLTAYQQQFSRRKKKIFNSTLGMGLLACVNAFMVGSASEADDLRNFSSHVPVEVVGVGVPLPQNASPVHKTSDTGKIRLLSVSRIAPKKRIDLMIATVAHLREAGEQADLVVAGVGAAPLVRTLQDQAAEAGIADHVSFVGEVGGAEKANLYREADVFIAPSDDENFGISVAEALSFGLGCVTSKHVASAVGLTPPAGVIVDHRDAKSLANAILTLLKHPERDRERASRAFVATRYSWTAVADRWLRVMKGDLKRNATL